MRRSFFLVPLTSLLAFSICGLEHSKVGGPIISPPPKFIKHGVKTSVFDPCTLAVSVKASSTLISDQFIQAQKSILAHVFNLSSCFKTDKDLKFNQNAEDGQEEMTGINTMEIFVNQEDHLLPQIENTDESYNLTVSEAGIQIQANQYSGAVRALSTLAYLIKDNGNGLFQIPHCPLTIQDEPSYPYRGLMIDTSRAFYPVDRIKELLDAMALGKFNVLHWHLVDDDSFPIFVKDYPNLSANGGYDSSSVYSLIDISTVVHYAETLAIRVIPEFDNPGHTRAIGLDPNFRDIILCFEASTKYNVPNAYSINGGPSSGVLDPTYEKTYTLISSLFKQFKAQFPDQFIHLGGDEVDQTCFDQNPNIELFKRLNHLASNHDLVNFHIKKARTLLTETSPDKKAMYWSNEDTFYQRYLDDDVLVYWGQSDNIATLKKTYPNNKIVFSPSDYYYLDCGYGNKYGGNSWCDPFKNWWRIYSFDPATYLDDNSVLGGEVCAWSELFREDNIHARIWPRAAAMADKMWAAKAEINLADIMDRLDALSIILLAKGIPITPLTGRYCEINSQHCFGHSA